MKSGSRWKALAFAWMIFGAHSALAQDGPVPLVITHNANGMNSVTFAYRSASAKSVELAGTFNSFDPRQTVLEKNGDLFSTTLELPDGAHGYKYVIDEKNWVADSTVKERDKENKDNSVIRLGGANSEIKPIYWGKTIKGTLSGAAQKQKRILAMFTASFTNRAAQLEEWIMTDPKVNAAVRSEFIPIRIDIEKQQEEARNLMVFKAGTVIIYGSDGSAIKRLDRFTTKEDFLNEIR